MQCRAKPEAEGELSLYSLWVRPPWPPACCTAAPETGKHHAQWLSDCVTGCSCRRLPWDGMLGVPGQWVFWSPSGRGSLVLQRNRVSSPAAVSVCAGLCMVASALVPCSCCHACEPVVCCTNNRLWSQPPHSHYIDPGRVLPGLPRRAAGGKPRRAAGGKAPQGENFRDCGRSTKAKWP